MVVINRNLLLISVYIELYILAYIYNLCSQGNDTLNEVLTKILKIKKKKKDSSIACCKLYIVYIRHLL